jgi:transaldolase/glucose-6-phosphate isomerase
LDPSRPPRKRPKHVDSIDAPGKISRLELHRKNAMMFELGPYQDEVDTRLERWERIDIGRRLVAKDPALWSPVPAHEIRNGLGWLSLKGSMRPRLEEFTSFAEEVRLEGLAETVLLGMGGSSLASEVLWTTFGRSSGHLALTVLDSTHPAAVRRVSERIDPRKTLFIVSSKSGTTLETLSLLEHFWALMEGTGGRRSDHFVAITDPDTPLARLATERGFRRTFDSPKDVGGRYSALSPFGLVPGALMGVDLPRFLDKVPEMSKEETHKRGSDLARGIAIGAALGELAKAGRDKLAIIASSSVQSLPMWIEQLVAESLGKEGRGIVPIIDEPPVPPEMYDDDRFFIAITVRGDESGIEERLAMIREAGHPTAQITMDNIYDLAREFFTWEVAVAIAAIILGVNPFDQPDVRSSKDLTRKMLEGMSRDASLVKDVETYHVEEPEALREALSEWSSQRRPGDYVSIQAFLQPLQEMTDRLQGIRHDLLLDIGSSTSLGYGPRFLHSSGQLHKGGPNTGLFLQLVDEVVDDVDVPGAGHTFGELVRAAALGDYVALRGKGRRVLRVCLGKDAILGMSKLEAEIARLQKENKLLVGVPGPAHDR